MPECQSRHVGSWVIRVSFDDVRLTSAFLPIAGGGIAKLAALRIVQKQIFANVHTRHGSERFNSALGVLPRITPLV